MVNEVKKKGDDGELLSIILVLGLIFTGTLIAVDVFYGNMSGLIKSAWGWPFIALHIVALIQWIVVIATKGEPNLEWVRWSLMFTLVATLILVMAHRSGWIAEKDFNEEVLKNKQEQQKKDTTIKQGILKLDTIIKK